MIKSLLAIAALIALCYLVLALFQSSHSQIVNADDLVYVIDGDTAIFKINGQKETVRFVGVDTPELKGQCIKETSLAKQARRYSLSALKSAQTIQLVSIDKERDKYGRLLRRVIVDGEELSDQLIDRELGREYGRGRRSWCD